MSTDAAPNAVQPADPQPKLRWYQYRLRTLDLSGTRVTDAGLVHLGRLSRLRMLQLTGTTVTAAGVKKLQKALPKCRIIRVDASPSP